MKKKALAAVLLLAGAVAACNESEAVEAPALATAVPETGDLRLTVEATGTVEPIRKVEVKSQASGEILRLHADVGDAVEPGTLLAEVDPRDVRNAYEQARADLDLAEARAQITTQQLNRQRELLEAGVITQQELETATLDAANAEANLVRSRTNFELAELRLRDVTISAPLPGTILERNVEEGTVIQSASQNVSGGTVLFVMAALESMQVRTLVDETDMGQLRAGMSSQVTVEAYPDRVFRGVVEKIEPQALVEQNVTMFPVIVTLDNRSGLLRPGMNAEVEILVDQASGVMLVPNGAIVNLQDVGPAAMALGMDTEELDLRSLMMAGRRGGGAPGAPQAGGSEEPAGAAAEGAAEGAGTGEAAAQPTMEELRAKVQSGEITRDSLRVLMQSRSGASGGAAPGVTAQRDVRPAAVFVVTDSLPELRMVQIGLNDWDNTEVVSGLDGDETLAVIGAAQLQAQQQAWLQRVRSRMGGGSPFGGGGMGRR